MSRLFRKEIEKGISEMCKEMGFIKKKYDFIKPLTDNVSATLNFGIYSHQAPGHIFVYPSAGVSYKDIEELYSRLIGADNYIFNATIQMPIGYIMPEDTYKEWDFVEGSNNTAVFEDLLRHIKTYGFEYFERMSDFNNLFKAFEIRTPCLLNISRDRRLPIIYYLMGEKKKGLKFIEEAIERENTPVDMESLIKEAKSTFPDAEVTIISSGLGRVDPKYLEFVERYKAL